MLMNCGETDRQLSSGLYSGIFDKSGAIAKKSYFLLDEDVGTIRESTVALPAD